MCRTTLSQCYLFNLVSREEFVIQNDVCFTQPAMIAIFIMALLMDDREICRSLECLHLIFSYWSLLLTSFAAHNLSIIN